MSGPIPHQIASAATRMAYVAKARAAVAAHQRQKRESDSLPGITWRSIPLATRKVIVALSCCQAGDSDAIAAQAWERFSPEDKINMAACARELRRSLEHAGSLF